MHGLGGLRKTEEEETISAEKSACAVRPLASPGRRASPIAQHCPLGHIRSRAHHFPHSLGRLVRFFAVEFGKQVSGSIIYCDQTWGGYIHYHSGRIRDNVDSVCVYHGRRLYEMNVFVFAISHNRNYCFTHQS